MDNVLDDRAVDMGVNSVSYCLLFDCDGVLVDSETLGTKVVVDVVAEYGVDLSLDEALHAFRGRKMTECVADLEQQLGRALPAHFIADVREPMPRRWYAGNVTTS